MTTLPVKTAEDRLLIKVVENEEEKQKSFLVRAIVYMHEQRCPYHEEFDLNDYSATHIVGLLKEEPVLAARIRYLPGMAKFERVAIRTEHRGKGYGHHLFRFMIDFSRQKGYHRLYLHAQSRLQHFYEDYGFHAVGNPFMFSDHEYVEMLADLAESEPDTHEAIPTSFIGSDPMRLNRPEGRLHQPGPLDESLARTGR